MTHINQSYSKSHHLLGILAKIVLTDFFLLVFSDDISDNSISPRVIRKLSAEFPCIVLSAEPKLVNDDEKLDVVIPSVQL